MRVILAAALLAVSLAAAAQSGARPRPPGTVPLDDIPPPPPMSQLDAAAYEPVVSTRMEGDQEVQEYRVKGKLFMQRVTPKHGKPYILIDHQGDGTMTRHDNPLDSGVRVPQWTLLEF